jgi:hypothetical protein
MKMRLLTIIGLAIGFALPTFAQQTNTPDPKLREALATFNKTFDDAMLKEDPAAVAALYTCIDDWNVLSVPISFSMC